MTGMWMQYMTFLAYNGPYKLFHWLYVGPLGAHDADWEHVTVRLSPDGQDVRGVYYSAHRYLLTNMQIPFVIQIL